MLFYGTTGSKANESQSLAPKPFENNKATFVPRERDTAHSMTLASVLRLFYHHAQAGSGALRDCRPLSCFLQPACARHSAYRQSLLVHSLHVSSCNRNNDLRRRRGAPSASVSDAPASTAVEEQLQWDEAEQELDPQQVLVLPAPSHSRVKTAEFVKSSTAVSQCPPSKHPEFAVIGRSNVGKSSLINMLTGKKALAQISKTPGKTKCINHFIINNSWFLVDLPGYGYAKRSKDTRLEWNEFTKDYLLNRASLANVFLLIDASIPPTQVDLECADWLGAAQVPFALVFTKLDKRKKGCPPPQENITVFKDTLMQEWEQLPFSLETSALKNVGRQDLLSHIASLRVLWQQEH